MTATEYVAAVKARGCRVSVGQITGRQVHIILESHAVEDIVVANQVAGQAGLEVEVVNPNKLIVTGFGR